MSNSINTTNSSMDVHRGPSEKHLIVLRVLQSLCGVLLFAGIPTNIIIVYLVYRLRTLRKSTYLFIASLAIADSLSLFNMLFFVAVSLESRPKWMRSERLQYYFFPSLDMFVGAASMLNVACISVDRAVAITCPLRYDDIVTRKRSKYILAGVWFYCGFILLTSLLRIPILDETYGIIVLYTGFALTYFIPMTIILISYSTIVASAIRNLKFTARWDRLMFKARCFNGNDMKRGRIRRKLVRELRVTGNILIIVVPFTIGWSYFIISQVYEEVHQYIDDFDHHVMMVVIPWLLSGLNPILYFFLTRPIRKGFFHFFKLHFSKHFNKSPNKSSRSGSYRHTTGKTSTDGLKSNTSMTDTNEMTRLMPNLSIDAAVGSRKNTELYLHNVQFSTAV